MAVPTSNWSQGEHLALIGKTGSGKTYLLRRILTLRGHSIILCVKNDTVGWEQFGWKTVSRASDIDPRKGQKWRLLAPYHRASEEHLRACQMVWAEENWCVTFDEAYYEKELGLEPMMIRFLTEGRAKRISCVVGMQRPAWVTKFGFSEPTHFFVGKLQRAEDLKRIKDELGRDVVTEIDQLDRFEFLYYNSITEDTVRVRESDALSALGATDLQSVGR